MRAIPSISALPELAEDVRKCCEWTRAKMERIGLQNIGDQTPGHPVVCGDWLAGRLPVCGHYDVARGPARLWESAIRRQFVTNSTRRLGRRQGQIFMHFKAIELT